MGGTITAHKVLTHPWFSLLCFLAICFILPHYGIVAVMVGSATVLSALVAVLPESFRSRSGSMVAAICLVAAIWVATAVIAGLALLGKIQG